MTPEQLAASLLARFNEYVVRSADGECWDWKIRINPKIGYPSLGTGKFGLVTMHRYSYELHRGPIPDGLWVLHKCDNHRCANPDHLYLGDHVQNQKDVRERQTSRKPACRRGHVRTAANTYVRTDRRGYVERHCKICAKRYPNWTEESAA